jgi:integrase
MAARAVPRPQPAELRVQDLPALRLLLTKAMERHLRRLPEGPLRTTCEPTETEAMKSAAAVVKHRGVEVRIYGPLADRKQEVWLLTRHNGSRREKKTVKGAIEEAKREAKAFAEQVSSGDAAMRLTPLQNRIYLTAQESAARVGRAVDALCREAAEAAAITGPGVSTVELARFWAAHHNGKLPVATPAQVIEQLASHLSAKRRNRRTAASLKPIYKRFAAAFSTPIAHITSDDLEAWLRTFPALSSRTLANYRAALTRLFNFAKGRFLPAEVPTAASRLDAGSATPRGAVEIFRPWEMARLLAHAPDKLRPCIAMGAFAGLRTIELTRLEWSAVRFPEEVQGDTAAKFPHGFILVDQAAAKQHRSAARRIIPMSANLLAWLEPFRMRTGPISPRRSDAKLSALITSLIGEINVREKRAHRPPLSRPRNGLRHSFGTYRLPVLNDTAALALEMNNSPREIIESYRELALPRDVEAWWQIAPVAPAEIIQLELLG